MEERESGDSWEGGEDGESREGERVGRVRRMESGDRRALSPGRAAGTIEEADL